MVFGLNLDFALIFYCIRRIGWANFYGGKIHGKILKALKRNDVNSVAQAMTLHMDEIEKILNGVVK